MRARLSRPVEMLCPRGTGGAGREAAGTEVVVDGAGPGAAATGSAGSAVVPRANTATKIRARTEAQADIKPRAR